MKRIVTLFLVCSITIFMACEGPQGPEGPQGQQGQQGPVGPAGEDGSMMYSGQGAPDANTGETGDYYLDTDTGELYGPKDDNGWGNPIIVLKGKDGEDGSQIYAGSGAPDPSLGNLGDFYLDQANYDMYGPKTESGWGSPINLKGADGNANVTRYIFPGFDFNTNSQFVATFNDITEAEMKQSSWSVYLMYDTGSNQIYYSIPGRARNIRYSVEHNFVNGTVYLRINTEPNQTGIPYDQIEIIRTQANSTQDNRKMTNTGKFTPEDLDFSDYEAVADYYGFYR